MRRSLFVSAVLLMAAATLPATAYAQRQRPSGGDQQQEDVAKKKKKDAEWGDTQAPLPALRNAGPCPFVKVLYDAGRYAEFKGGQVASNAVGFTGEIQGVSAGCAYKDDEPITMQMEILFELGKGPAAEGSQKNYRYWVAVTKRNSVMIAKQYFDLPVAFQPGQDRLYATEEIGQLVIPRADIKTSGSNFEVLVGFDVTPEMAAFNREGKRFRLTAGATSAKDAGDHQ
ncbi:MAG TPA: Tat pathway signal sequence domain protein [Phenylobacterium sp.]|uniref:Tat pathway signal sequence domain protein n=1 Tax=Phenylobacterium conjunctum TaxID=1298959 RepID=A0ABW3T622_9CAUL|nr:Tat pathway signal sequence domain protein [Phenylobacterium sp.]HQP19227.1 Tat pathway signal sequence domain protein [Phenylobacterium sp.]